MAEQIAERTPDTFEGETQEAKEARTGRYAAPERDKSEFPRHRMYDPIADRSLPVVALRADELGPDGESLIPRFSRGPQLDPADVVGEITVAELPENYLNHSADPSQWLDEVLAECIEAGASDVLMQTDENSTWVTIDARIDNLMRPVRKLQGRDARTVMVKFKTTSSLSTGVSYVPEEAQYELEFNGARHKVRIASFRTAVGGIAVSMRLPNIGEVKLLKDLGFTEENLKTIYRLLSSANGMLLIAGPMGEGKTTTAHAALMHVCTPTRTVWTIEDPVERILPGLVQIEVDEENKAGYDVLLPALVRSNYDTLFLGEIRDEATAAAGVRQAKAGRQVISTIHANNNITALLRLIDLSEDSALSVMDSTRAVISQRLVSKLNPDWDGRDPLTRYKGRLPVHEILEITPALAEAVMRGEAISRLQAIAGVTSRSTFAQALTDLVESGVTDEAEALRVLGV